MAAVMSTKRTYFCNVCGDELRIVSNDFGKDGYGFSFDNGESSWRNQAIQHAENHICKPCLIAAMSFAAAVKVN